MKNILIINGHPNPASYCMALGESYKNGALSAGANVEEVILNKMQFDPILRYGYSKRMDLEPDLLDAWEKIKKADHLVIIFPMWWGNMPALLKGFFDRLFLPGLAFSYRENSVWWDKLLKGRTGRLIITMDQPPFYHYLVNWAPVIRSLKKMVLEFCGVSPVSTTSIGPIRNSTEEYRKKYLEKVFEIGKKMK